MNIPLTDWTEDNYMKTIQRKAIRVKHTPNCRHPYTATLKGVGYYGFGLTPKAAKESLLHQMNNPNP